MIDCQTDYSWIQDTDTANDLNHHRNTEQIMIHHRTTEDAHTSGYHCVNKESWYLIWDMIQSRTTQTGALEVDRKDDVDVADHDDVWWCMWGLRVNPSSSVQYQL
jgi:hypothetical protein